VKTLSYHLKFEKAKQWQTERVLYDVHTKSISILLATTTTTTIEGALLLGQIIFTHQQ